MTYSIVARDERTGQIGIAAASGAPSVGSLLPHVVAGIGAVATQGAINGLRELGAIGISLMDRGLRSDVVVSTLVRLDEGRDHHQFHVIREDGAAAAHTGKQCLDWAGHVIGGNVSVAGNTLAGPQVLDAMLDAFQRGAHRPFEERLFATLSAGEASGGDRRGVRSAVVTTGRQTLRVDDAADPLRQMMSKLSGRAMQANIAKAILFGGRIDGDRVPTDILSRSADHGR